MPANAALHFFLSRPITINDFAKDESILQRFVQLDDFDIWSAVKCWATHDDLVLSYLSRSMLDRHLLKIVLSPTPFDADFQLGIQELIAEKFKLPLDEAALLCIAGRLSNNAYDAAKGETIDVLTKSGHILNVAEASDLPNIQALSKGVDKFYICYPKELRDE